MQGIEVAGATLRNRGDLDVSGSRLTVGTGSGIAENGTTFDASESKIIFNGSDQSISGSGSAGDDTVDIIFEEIILRDETLVDPSLDVKINTDLTVNLGSEWGAVGEDARVTFDGDNFAVLQATTVGETDAKFRASQIRFTGSSVTSVKGEVFSDVRVESDLSLAEDFEIDGFYEHLTSTVTVGTSNSLDLEQDAEINGNLTVNGTLQFSGLGGTSTGIGSGEGGDDSVQDVVGTGTFSFSGLEILGAGTDVEVRRTSGQVLDVGTLFIEGTPDIASDASLDVTSDVFVSGGLTADGNFTLDGKLTMDGSGAQTLSASDPFEVNVLESANSASQDLALASGTEVRVIDILELAAGTFDVSQGTLTLESSGTSHGIITYSGGDISGNITAERELSTGPDWYFLANPEGTTYDDMLRQGNQNNFWIQGHSGADISESGASFQNTNLLEFNEQEADSSRDNSWSRSLISSMSDPAERGKGFILFPFTDDNNDGSPDGFAKQLNIQATPTTTNSFSFPVTATDRNDATTSDSGNLIDAQEGWNLLGNPYFTNIAWTELSRTNVDNAVYVYEPLSGYATFNGSTTADGDSTFVSDGIIGPFQAFFVKASDGTDPATASYDLSVPNIQQVQRDSLSANLNSDPFLKSAGAGNDRVLALGIDAGGITENAKFTFRPDGALGKDVSDAYQLKGPGGIESRNFLSLYSVLENGNGLSINNLPYSLEDDVTIPVQPKLKGCDGASPYTTEATLTIPETRNIPAGWTLQLKDSKTGESINLRQSAYTFTLESSTPTSECSGSKSRTAKSSSSTQSLPAPPSPEVVEHPVTAKSGGPDTRFQLVIDPTGGSGSGDDGSGNSTIQFGDFLQENGSSNPKVSLPASSVVLQHNFRAGWTDVDPDAPDADAYTRDGNTITINKGALEPGTHEYRLKASAKSSGDKTSKVVRLNVKGEELTTYPNPASQGQATVEFVVEEPSDVTVSLYNTLGQKVRTLHRGTVKAGETMRETIDVQSLASGVYFVRMRGDGVMSTTRMTIVK